MESPWRYSPTDIKSLLFDNEEGWTKAGLNVRQKANLEELLDENKRD